MRSDRKLQKMREEREPQRGRFLALCKNVDDPDGDFVQWGGALRTISREKLFVLGGTRRPFGTFLEFARAGGLRKTWCYQQVRALEMWEWLKRHSEGLDRHVTTERVARAIHDLCPSNGRRGSPNVPGNARLLRIVREAVATAKRDELGRPVLSAGHIKKTAQPQQEMHAA